MINYVLVLILIYLALLAIILYSYHDIMNKNKHNKRAEPIVRHLYVNIIMTFTIMYIVLAGLDAVPTIHNGISSIIGSII